MPKKHPLAKYQKIKIEQLRNDKWVELNKDLCPAILEDVEVYCRNAGFSRDANIVQEVSNMELLAGLVSAGIGIAIYPSLSANLSDEIVSKELTFSDNTRLELTKILAFKETLDEEYLHILNSKFDLRG
ncbi:HTH-type transcriptional regulator GltC [compost metagenome]